MDKAHPASLPLRPYSGLGTPAGEPGRDVAQVAGLRVQEECGLMIFSLRCSRIAADAGALDRWLGTAGLASPQAVTAQTGDAGRSCFRAEPGDYLAIGAFDQAPGPAPGWFCTDISDRLAAFRLCGERAREVLSSGGNLHGMAPGVARRLPFAESVAVFVQQFSETDFRLLVDVSFAPFMAEWLADAAANLCPPEEIHA